MVESRERFTANNADIGEMCARVERFLARGELEERERRRLCLTVERLLRRIAERRGYGARCELALGRRWGRAFIRLSYLGDAFDPTRVGRESESEAWSARLVTGLGLVPEWSWRRGVNSLTLCVRDRERRALDAPLLAAALGIALRFALAAAGGGFADAAERLVLTPLLEAFFGAASLLAAGKMFFALLAASCGAAETASGRVGRATVVRFLASDILWAFACVFALSALYGAPCSGGSLTALWRLVPTDPLALLGEPGQLAVLGAASGAAVAMLGGRVQRLREWAEQCDDVLGALFEGLCRLTPLAVLAALCRVSASVRFAAWKPLAAFIVCGAVIALCCLFAAALRLRVSLWELLRRAAPPMRAALRTGSFAAAFGATMDNCENRLGIGHRIVLTGLSVGGVLWKPFAALCFCALSLYGAPARSAGELLLTALAALALCVALPMRPGAFLIALPLLPRTAGFDAADVALAAFLDAPLAALGAALGVAALQWELLKEAKRLGEWNEKLWE